ncbi:MAG: TlpA disulfide reductase family protein [Acidobacteriota bacterium]
MNNGKFISSSLALVVLSGLMTVLFSAGCSDAAAPKAVTGAEPAMAAKRPPINEEAIKKVLDVPISKLDGSTFKLEDHRGKVLVVDFWGTFCPPCVKQVPELIKLNDKYRDRGLVLVGLTADPKSDQKLVEEFIKKFGVNYQIGYDNNWLSSAFLKGTEDDSGSPPIPQLFVITRDGRVIEHLVGEQPGRMEYLEKIVNEQLGAAR